VLNTIISAASEGSFESLQPLEGLDGDFDDLAVLAGNIWRLFRIELSLNPGQYGFSSFCSPFQEGEDET
jgi:hypothetical protein